MKQLPGKSGEGFITEMNNLFNNYYDGRKVLVTGHSGFKGSWLCLWLQRLGAQVVGFSSKDYENNLHSLALNLDIAQEFGDVCDAKALQRTMDRHQPEIIFHLAAQPLVLSSYDQPLETFEINVMGTLNVLQAVRKTESVIALINVTTDKVYEDIETSHTGCDEEDRLGGHDPYSASKACSEIVTSSYRRSFLGPEGRVLCATARAGNVIGGGDWSRDRLIPDLIKAATTNQTVEIRNQYASRPWQHVLEPLSGYLMLGRHLLRRDRSVEGGWNFGPASSVVNDVGTVVEQAQRHWDAIQIKLADQNRQHIHEANFLALSSAKAHRDLGWRPVWNFEQTIQSTINWYRCYSESGELRTESDLEKYVADARKLSLPWTQTDETTRNTDNTVSSVREEATG